MEKKNQVVGRFAPSPSGFMHLGNVFSALLAWLSARSAGGRVILRIEDLDPDRSKLEYADAIRRDLCWLGLDWDEESQRQSERTDYYRKAFDHLEALGLVYPCYCTRAELHAACAPHASDGRLIYAGTCRNLTSEDRARYNHEPAWRIRIDDNMIAFEDGVFGQYQEELAVDCGDFIIRRSDGVYAYQLAVVVDDADMGVTQVVRGYDLLSSTPRQLYLYDLLNLKAPEFYHVPLLTASDGRRLSKRDGDLDMRALRATYSAPELIGLLAYAAGILNTPQAITPTELIDSFSWTLVPKKESIDIRRIMNS